MYRILMSYLERLPGAMEMREMPSGKTQAVCLYSPHVLRATTATELLDSGVPIKSVQAWQRRGVRCEDVFRGQWRLRRTINQAVTARSGTACLFSRMLLLCKAFPQEALQHAPAPT